MEQSELRDTVSKLLADGTVDMVIGWERGSVPMTATPLFINAEEDAGRLVFDSTCGNNLTVYFTKDARRISGEGKRIGVVVKGCDARSLVLSIMEKQVKRSDVTIIGVPCNGVVDRRKIERRAGGKEILEFAEAGDEVVVKGEGFELSIPLNDVLSDSCLSCTRRDAQEYDVFIGEPRKPGNDEGAYAEVEEFEKLSSAERWDWMVKEYSSCIRCYACRNVCPACYCSVCFVDQNDPQWIGKTTEITDTMIFHIIRNLHVAGRCVECGACERACPMGIKLLKLNRKVAKEVRDRFGRITGAGLDEKPAMADFREDEKQDFIMG